MRYFNTAGPVRCDDHYCLPPLSRLNLDDVMTLIAQEKYFVLHAPRQAGKTSYLLALMDHLNRGGLYRCLYFNVEVGQYAREDAEQGIRALLGEMASAARTLLNDPFPESIWQTVLVEYGPGAALNQVLTRWCAESTQPLVLLVDEIDALVGDTLIAVLRQLRAGYIKRPELFPQSVVLCGVRDVRDYRIHSDRDKATITGGSAFNIKAESLRLGDFSRSEIETLYGQHSAETGQVFEPAALDLAWELTRGQPWLVNALAYEACFRVPEGQDRAQPITAALVIAAKERLIERHETHLDQLTDKLREDRVRRVIEPIVVGTGQPALIPTDDIDYVRDLGLIRTDGGQLAIANAIYQEIIPRALTYSTQLTITQEAAWYVLPDGRLDIDRLLEAFQAFFREHSEHWVERFDYKEAGPQLLLQAFLQRIVNGGGRIEREYGLGRRRTDLLVVWGTGADTQRVVIELKLLRGTWDRTLAEGLAQTRDYVDRCGAESGHLVVFDRDPKRSWDEKVFMREETVEGRVIKVWGV